MVTKTITVARLVVKCAAAAGVGPHIDMTASVSSYRYCYLLRAAVAETTENCHISL